MRTKQGRKQIQVLLDRLCATLGGRIAPRTAEFLGYMAGKWTQYDRVRPNTSNEHAIGCDFFQLAPDWESKENMLVRTHVFRARDALWQYFQDMPEGRREKYQIKLSRHPYILELVPNRLNLQGDKKFWDAHKINKTSNMIIHTEALWFWDARNRAFTRFLDINANSLDGLNIAKVTKHGHPARKMTPCFHYQSAGEVQATHYLERWLIQNHLQYSVEFSRDLVLESTLESGHNLIVLGNSRSNKFVAAAHEGLPISLGTVSIAVRGASEKAEYSDDDVPASKESMQRAYVLVTRRPSRDHATYFTAIVGNNGRAIEKAVQILTDADALKSLLAQVVPESKEVPEVLQIVFRVEIMDYRPAHGDPKVVAYASGTEGRSVRILWLPSNKTTPKRKS